MRYAIKCNRDTYYVRSIDPKSGACGWTPDIAEAQTWSYADVAEKLAEGIGHVITVGTPGNGDW